MNLRLRERREAQGLNQKELAQKVGKSFRTIQSWEREESYPNAELVGALCEVFNTDPNDLLGWYEEHPEGKPTAPAGARRSWRRHATRPSCPKLRLQRLKAKGWKRIK